MNAVRLQNRKIDHVYMYTRKIDARGARQTGNFLEQGIMFRSRPGWLAMRERIQRNYPD